MDRKKQIAALTDDEGERLLLAQACERLTRAEQRGIPAATVFLTPREQPLLRQLLPQCRFWGGTPDAERAVAYWLPEYEDEDDYRENGPVACLRAAFFEENAVGHRDMLGALMGCGIRREAVGDLCLQPRQCDLFVTAELAPYLLDNLTSAGRAHLTLTRIAPSQADRPPQALQELRVTVSSPRLDSVISAAFHLSRGSAADAVAEELGIAEVHSELLPEDKVTQVERLLGEGAPGKYLAFVGDGINDAPVLARADLGAAMGGIGSDAAIEAADIVLMDDDPRKLSLAMRISRKTMRLVWENIVFALAVKAVCLVLGALGIANMWVAIFADVGVMVLCVLNAARALNTKHL